MGVFFKRKPSNVSFAYFFFVKTQIRRQTGGSMADFKYILKKLLTQDTINYGEAGVFLVCGSFISSIFANNISSEHEKANNQKVE